eukprot:CAMPEP_0197026736 /NCGR_PEP_ID=MMETSP1384-20130603/6765_1 /TAXON_ID=29189 /ORGANISM="Ammonia sp." /LENGTH=376 /DNA_ID=CAMNT_0042455457 /DNA_START=69 /DNA_END=1199 /DNA_ORIENTATION=-
MNRPPRDPRDPFDDPFFDKRGGGFDPFNDPFFKHFERIQQSIFRDFFGDDGVSIFSIEGPNSSQHLDDDSQRSPDLSQINPNAPASRNNGNQHAERNSPPSFFRFFDHFFEPEYDEHKLSDINPNVSPSDNAPIMNDESDNKGLMHPDASPRGFRSPYLPHWNGAEKQMEFENNQNGGGPKTFYRSQSVVISTGPDGKTRKTTTIRDSSGQESSTTEEYDANDAGGAGAQFPRIFNWNDDEKQGNERALIWPYSGRDSPPLFEQTHDPFARFREKWQNWRWNPFNWYEGRQRESNRDRGGYTRSGDGDGSVSEWFWKSREGANRDQHRNDRILNDANRSSNGKREGFKWRSYRDYQSESNKRRGPSLLDDIVKKDD